MKKYNILFVLMSCLSAGVSASKRGYSIDPSDRAVIEILRKQHAYMPSGCAKEKVTSYLLVVTDNLPGGSLNERIEHLMIHGVKAPYRKEAIKLAAAYLSSGY